MKDYMDILGKLPPQNIDTEKAILGALMLERDAFSDVADLLHKDVFYRAEHQKIYEIICHLFVESKPVDILTVTSELRRQGVLEEIGGAFYITELTNGVAGANNINHHAMLIYESFLGREALKICSEAINRVYNGDDAFDVIGETDEALTETLTRINSKQLIHVKYLMKDFLTELDKMIVKREQGQLRGINTNIIDLDYKLHGFLKQDLIIVAGRPGMGKTTFALQLAKNMSQTNDVPVAFFSLEMSKEMITNKLVSNITGVNLDKILSGNITAEEMQKINSCTASIEKTPLYIDDSAGISTMELRAKVKRLVHKQGIKIVFIDYLQLMSLTKDSGHQKVNTRENEVSAITRQLKNIAKEFDIPIVCLCQLSRAVESRSNKRPQLSDLRESGSIEQDADRVLFLYRDDYYEAESMTDGMDVIIAKNRHGETGTISLKYEKSTSKIKDTPF
jgi:replicative DNA helicase